jgi:chaperonin cofactor prefoldin
MQYDIDDYINSLTKKIEELESINENLKKEIRIQRKEIAGLREEIRAILDNDKPPGLCIDW